MGIEPEERDSSSVNKTQVHSSENSEAMKEGVRDATDELVDKSAEGKKEADPPADSGQTAEM